ncbi:lipoate--protein ligase family protein [soil metagenome]
MRAPSWRLILGTGNGAGGLSGAAGAVNMAVDQALLASVQAGGPPVLRLYAWDPPCLSLGRNQHAAGLYDMDRAAGAGTDIVRRPTGGLAVLHDRELTYCVLAPIASLGGARAAYASINSALVHALRGLGVPAELAGMSDRPARRPAGDAADPCFQAPAPGEVVAAGRKLVGSAQRCEGGALLQHGSILLDGTQADVLDLLVPRERPPGARDRPPGARDLPETVAGSVTLCELLGVVPPVPELVEALQSSFSAMSGIPLAPDSLTREERARAYGLEAHFRAAAWTWRR